MITFTLVVEGKSEDLTKVAPPALELKNLQWDGDEPPDVVALEQGTVLVKVGHYLSAGDRYGYRVAAIGRLTAGQLVSAQFVLPSR